MVFALKFEVLGGDTLIRQLDIAIGQLKDFSVPLQESMELIKAKTDQNFAKKTSDTAWRWSSLSPSTTTARANRRWYYKNAPSNPGILRWTWRLQESVKIAVTSTMWSIEYTAPYAVYHQMWGWDVPRRKFLELDTSTKAEIARKFQTYVYNSLNKK